MAIGARPDSTRRPMRRTWVRVIADVCALCGCAVCWVAWGGLAHAGCPRARRLHANLRRATTNATSSRLSTSYTCAWPFHTLSFTFSPLSQPQPQPQPQPHLLTQPQPQLAQSASQPEARRRVANWFRVAFEIACTFGAQTSMGFKIYLRR